ncbi:MAG: UDP-N-acetylmuramate dehydrogenase [Desulfovibrio sp.]|jgi:UDP-N-acetylmuramate dehydrogenase|nr:UDP-N-acetylmuramate dehydrogenase [Desulfovibrio sp.]
MREEAGAELSGLTTLGMGGTCAVALSLDSREDLPAFEARRKELGLPCEVLARGSNILAREGRHELVLVRPCFADAPALASAEAAGAELGVEEGAWPEGTVFVTCGAGVALPRLLAFLRDAGLSGMEGLAGIPGSVGGAVAMNAGSFGCETGACLASVEVWNGEALVRIPRQGFDVGYRHFAVKGALEPVLVVSAAFALTPAPSSGIAERMQANLLAKKSRQPVTARSAGCVFKNPPEGPSAGMLLDRAGFRGRTRGGVALSEMHANFLVNRGGGTAEDAFALLGEAQEAVLAKFGVALEYEVRVLPCRSF